MRAPLLPVGLTLIASLTLSGCSSAAGSPGTPSPSPSATYLVPPQTARPDETVIKAPLVTDGLMRFRVLAFRDGMPSLVGSHAEWPAKGQYVRVRVLIESIDRSNQKFDAKEQLAVASDGRTFHVDLAAQTTKRQPFELQVGSFVRMEFDLWFDVPKDVKITKMRFFGDPPLGVIGRSKGVEVTIR
ncbi:hypothetical protein Sme01_32240 [Sphaerisporangium melleum]|uniref:DUF4352 domain-containing protein n=1 Tax=Sphaerisporangium melleum TaxID=321316 RepID=A0A917VRE7_9ACTN|nr:hypothetical protein [Sphaerisporangium melleum]GGL10337.1 hypothetical protein GCM10007964_60650 [Sphaerisporangium melleum]GII70748.1 hypothetical protein Sme01_32240 [Sphaerisporangium melleum]